MRIEKRYLTAALVFLVLAACSVPIVQANSDSLGERKDKGHRGLTEQQREQVLETMISAGLTKGQAEAILSMSESGSPADMEKVIALDPRVQEQQAHRKALTASQQNSYVRVRYDGIDYPLQFNQIPQCADFFSFSYLEFSAGATPEAKRGPTLLYNAGGHIDSHSFSFWLDFNPQTMFDRKYATAHFTIVKEQGRTVGYEGYTRGPELNLSN